MWDSGAVPAAPRHGRKQQHPGFNKGDIGIVSNSNSIMAKLTAVTGGYKTGDL
jgi:hypothetical protein